MKSDLIRCDPGGTTRMHPESSKRFQVNEISFPASGYEPEGREFESLRAHHSYPTVRLSHLSHAKDGAPGRLHNPSQ